MLSIHNGAPVVSDNFAFPLAINTTSSDGGDTCKFKLTIKFQFNQFILILCSVEAVIDHSYNRDLLPLPIVVRSNIQERQIASKIFYYYFHLVQSLRFLYIVAA